MTDEVARYRAATEANDIDAIMATLAAEAELVSPISGRMVFRGHDDLRALLSAVYGSLTDLQWDEEIGDQARRVVIGAARIGNVKLSDAMVLDLSEDGLIRRIRPHLRPWLGLTVFTLVVGLKLAAHPAVIWRAVRRRR